MKNTIKAAFKADYVLVYQAGIANVVLIDHKAGDQRCPVMQTDFKTAESYCRGLRDAGKLVVPAWCNEAGDIVTRCWNYDNFDNAPFCESFSRSFVPLPVA